jgi:hypothetical protein
MPVPDKTSSQLTQSFVDPEIEAALLAGILQQKEDVINSGLRESIKENHFVTPAYQFLVGRVFPKYPQPAKPILSQFLVENVEALDEREKLSTALLRLYDLDVSKEFQQDTIDIFRKFLAFQEASTTIRKFYEDFGRTKNVELGLRELTSGLVNSAKLMEKQKIAVIDYTSTFSEREAKRRYKRDNPDLFPVLRMGVWKFDAQIKMKAGTVTNFLAPMKRYKSVILASLAFAGLLQGFNVALVVLENTVELTLDRLDSMFTQINYDRIVNSLMTLAERKVVDDLFAKMAGWPQRLKIIKGDPHLMGTVEVRRELDILRKLEGYVADVKIFDYLNIMRPSTGGQADDHLGQTQLTWDLQQEAKHPGEECVVVTATQSNMAGAEVDKEGKPIRLRQHHQGRAIGIAQAVDATIGIDIEQGKVEDGVAQPPQIILSPLYLRDGVILYPEVRLVSELDRMQPDREMKRLWDEVG